MIQLLQEYLRINTSHPTPNYAAVGKLFAHYAQRDGLEFQEILLPSGLPVYCISLVGSDTLLPALALNHHMDVVSADAREWEEDPFEGAIKNGVIFGRGAQDCKSLGIAHYGALVRLRHAASVKRTVHMLLVPHEEVGGFTGVGQLVETERFKRLNIGYVLDEGIPSGNPDSLYIKVSERKPLQIKLTVMNIAGHAARIDAPNAVHDLLQALDTCRRVVQAANTGDLVSSCTVTSLYAGSEHAHNVIPARAQATLDIRVAAQTSIIALERALMQALTQHSTVTVEVRARVPDVPAIAFEKSLFYRTLNACIKKSGMRGVPLHFEASSDLRWYQAANIEGYGFTPFTCTPNLHGVNESVPIFDIHTGIEIFMGLITELENI